MPGGLLVFHPSGFRLVLGLITSPALTRPRAPWYTLGIRLLVLACRPCMAINSPPVFAARAGFLFVWLLWAAVQSGLQAGSCSGAGHPGRPARDGHGRRGAAAWAALRRTVPAIALYSDAKQPRQAAGIDPGGPPGPWCRAAAVPPDWSLWLSKRTCRAVALSLCALCADTVHAARVVDRA